MDDNTRVNWAILMSSYYTTLLSMCFYFAYAHNIFNPGSLEIFDSAYISARTTTHGSWDSYPRASHHSVVPGELLSKLTMLENPLIRSGLCDSDIKMY